MGDFILSKEKHIECILENFDFVKVYNVMYNLGWTWYDSDNTPTINRLKESAKKLLEDVYNYDTDDVYYLSSGGFKATKKDNFLELEFVIEDTESDILNYGDEYEKIKKNKERNNKIVNINKLNK